MIEVLSSDQEELLHQVCAEWSSHHCSVEPADRDEAEHGICDLYTTAGLDIPERIIWEQPPLSGIKVADDIQKTTKDSYIQSRLTFRPRNEVWEKAEGLTHRSVWDQVFSHFLYHLWSSAEGKIRGRLKIDACTDRYWRARPGAHFGNIDSSVLARTDFWTRIFPDMPNVSGLLRIGRSAGWWWAMHNTVVLTDRPVEFHQDERGQLSSKGGISIAYSDGWEIPA